ncbi:uncharacterized protein METZ01_LOCUS127739, partial [marine metagenome]
VKIFNILLFFLSLFIISCSDDDLDPDDCAGEPGGDAICGCTDSLAANFDGLATHDDGSCEYVLNGVPIKWLKTYNDLGDESWSVDVTSDGGFIIAGASNYTGLLIKTDSDGELKWHKTYENSTTLYSARETSDGGFIAAGYYECDTLPGCYPDIYLLKTDGSGTMEWDKTDDSGENNDWAKDVIESQDGNFVITGTWNDDGWNSKAMLRKYSSSGDLMWGKTFSNSTANEGEAMMETNEGDIIFVGYSGTQHGAYNHYMVKANSDGEQIWKKKTSSIGDALLYAVCPSPNGGYVGAGFCNSFRSNFLVERNSSGNKQWDDCFIDETSHYGYYDITPASGGGYYLIDDICYLTKTDEAGSIIFSVQLNHVNQSVIELDDGDVVMGGYGFREGNSGGPISLLRLDPSAIPLNLR